jgi:mycothiol synthase
MSADPPVETDVVLSSTGLSTEQADDVRRLASSTAATDGAVPLNEAALLQLRHDRPNIVHLRVLLDHGLAGYAQLENGPHSSVGQLFVAPRFRRRGIGGQLVAALRARADHPLQVWAVGNSAAAQALAAQTGLVARRELLIMKRDLGDDLPESEPSAGITIRTFRPGQDENAWLAVNAAAFADHPEQGSITRDDLDDRMAEPWFDPAGFFVATAGEQLLGFHWTKQHQDHLGEVYVLGVAPDAAGRGLGKALLLTGLRHLRERGNTTVELYVEADNPAAVGLYRAYGFTPASRDVMYAAG